LNETRDLDEMVELLEKALRRYSPPLVVRSGGDASLAHVTEALERGFDLYRERGWV
jgi:hypothetical protein